MRISVILSALTGEFDTDLNRSATRAEKRLRDMSNTMAGGISRLNSILGTLGIGLGLGALVGFTKGAANAATQTKAMAENVGLSVEQFSALTYAARQSEATQEDLSKALFKVNNLLKEGAEDGSKAAGILAGYGITSEEIRSGAVGTAEALKRIADRFNAMPDGIDKSALATQLLGEKLAQKLIPFLNSGSKGFEEFARQGEAAGAILTDKVAAAVDKADDALAAFNQTLQTKVLVGLTVFFGLVEANVGDKKLEELAEQITGLDQELAQLIATSDAADTGGILGKLLHIGDAARIVEIRNELAALRKERDRLKNEQMDRIVSGGAKAAGVVTPAGLSPDELKKRENAVEELGAKIRKFNREIFEAADAQEKAIGEAIRQHSKDVTEAANAERAVIQSVIDKYDQEGAAIRARSNDIELLMRAAAGGSEEAVIALNDIASGVNEVGEEADEALDQMSIFADEAARNMHSSFADFLFDPFKDGVDGMLKGFARTLQRMATEAAAAKVFEAIGGWGKANSGAGGFMGFIATLVSSFGGERASGGPVSGGTPYIVGEEGPELFMPKSSGTIIPNGGWGGGRSVNITYNVDAKGADPASAANMIRALMATKQQVKAEIYDEMWRGSAQA